MNGLVMAGLVETVDATCLITDADHDPVAKLNAQYLFHYYAFAVQLAKTFVLPENPARGTEERIVYCGAHAKCAGSIMKHGYHVAPDPLLAEDHVGGNKAIYCAPHLRDNSYAWWYSGHHRLARKIVYELSLIHI